MALFFLFVIFAVAVPDDILALQSCKTMSRNLLLECFSSLVDIDHNNVLSVAEIASFLTGNNITGSENTLMQLCDTNADGSLDMTDWNAPNACAQSQPFIRRICNICIRAGWSKSEPLVT